MVEALDFSDLEDKSLSFQISKKNLSLIGSDTVDLIELQSPLIFYL